MRALPRMTTRYECTKCGACCVAPDISALRKPPGVRCRHLGADNLCTQYETRPAVCRNYRPDELCERIAAPALSERVANYMAIFGLERPGGGAAAGAGEVDRPRQNG